MRPILACGLLIDASPGFVNLALRPPSPTHRGSDPGATEVTHPRPGIAGHAPDLRRRTDSANLLLHERRSDTVATRWSPVVRPRRDRSAGPPPFEDRPRLPHGVFLQHRRGCGPVTFFVPVHRVAWARAAGGWRAVAGRHHAACGPDGRGGSTAARRTVDAAVTPRPVMRRRGGMTTGCACLRRPTSPPGETMTPRPLATRTAPVGRYAAILRRILEEWVRRRVRRRRPRRSVRRSSRRPCAGCRRRRRSRRRRGSRASAGCARRTWGRTP